MLFGTVKNPSRDAGGHLPTPRGEAGFRRIFARRMKDLTCGGGEEARIAVRFAGGADPEPAFLPAVRQEAWLPAGRFVLNP